MPDGWKKKFKGDDRRGGAWIYTRAGVPWAIVENGNGVSFGGKMFKSVDEAKAYAIANHCEERRA